MSRNPNVHYRTHKRPPPVSILGQPNPVHIPTSHLLEIRLNISPFPKVHYRTHKRPPPVSILGQPNPVHTPTSYLLEIHPTSEMTYETIKVWTSVCRQRQANKLSSGRSRVSISKYCCVFLRQLLRLSYL